jgi:eukaryotic-like serine/threonine-protein kinase
MMRPKVKLSLLLVAVLAAALSGCQSLDMAQTLGEGMETQFQRRAADIETAVTGMLEALGRSAENAEKRVSDLAESLKGKYDEGRHTRKLVYFTEDADVTPATVIAKPGVDGPRPKDIVLVHKEVQANLLAERTLEHRGLRLLWKLGLDGTGVRYANISNGYLYVVTKGHRVYAIEIRAGLTRWVARLGGRPDSPPGFNDDYMVISAGDVIHVIDKRSGKDKWRFETSVQPASRPYCNSVSFVYGCWNGDVVGFQFGDRHPRWQFRADDRVFVAPYLIAGQTFAAADNGTLTKYNTVNRVSAVDVSLSGRPVGLLGTKDMVYVGTDNFEMFGVRVADGSKSWTHAPSGRVMAGPWLSKTGSVLYYAARNDGFYALTAVSGRQRWKIANGVKPVGVHGDHMFVLRSNGGLCYTDAATGEIKWTESIAPFVTAVDNIERSTVYLISGDGQIYAVAPKK